MRRSARLSRLPVYPPRHHGAVGLTIVTGPANSAKAQVVLDATAPRSRAGRSSSCRARPTSSTTAASWRARGSVLGVRVEPLRRPAARDRATRRPRPAPIGAHARERLLAASLARRGSTRSPAPRRPRASRARSPASSPSSRRGASRPRAVSGAARLGARRAARARYGGARGPLRRLPPRLERLGRLDGELPGGGARRAAARARRAGARTPVFCYGFDDLDPLQLDAIETLAHRVGAAVTISLPGEPGASRSPGAPRTLETLRAAAPRR